MNTKDIKYFRALVRYQNYTRVSEKFGISQPSVTQAIKRLEKEFDVQLVQQDRTHQKTVITRAGLLLDKNFAQIEHSIQLAHKEIESTKTEIIRFGLPPIIGTLYFPQVAGELLSSGLLQKTNILESGSDELLRYLKKGDIDIALLGSVRPIHFNEIRAVNLGSRPFTIIASPKHHLAQKDKISFKELGSEKFISLTGRYVHPMAFKAYCEYADISPEIVYSTSDISWAKSLVKENLGISLIVKDVIQENDGVKCIKIVDSVPVRFNVSVAIRSGYKVSESEREFIEVVKKMIVKN